MLWSLFLTFMKIGFLSFGGGYAMIPVIQHEVEVHGWISQEKFIHTVSLAGMGPGPIAANSATLIGYETAGIAGAAAATVGMLVPSLLIIICIAACMRQVQHSDWTRTSFYGLRPVVLGLMIFSAIHFGLSGHSLSPLNWKIAGTMLITGVAVVGMLKFRLHPFAMIVLTGLLGIVLFQ